MFTAPKWQRSLSLWPCASIMKTFLFNDNRQVRHCGGYLQQAACV